MKNILLAVVITAIPLYLQAQTAPIIDVHLHSAQAHDQGPPPVAMCVPIENFPTVSEGQTVVDSFMHMLKNPPCEDPVWSPETDEEIMEQTIEVMERLNIIGVLSGPQNIMKQWIERAPDRFIPGYHFRIHSNTPTPEQLRELHQKGELAVLGEVVTQYSGILPNDPQLEPYWALAEELDIPVGIHVGTGPPGTPYLGFPNYRAAHHSALTIEEVAIKYPNLRIYLMHAGYPMLDDLLAVLYTHPNVYVDVGVIIFTQPRNAFYRYLQGIVEAGFGKRVMFGSDQMVWPGVIERSVNIILDAPFLSEDQKRDILYNNAAKFLRLSDEEIAKHHGR